MTVHRNRKKSVFNHLESPRTSVLSDYVAAVDSSFDDIRPVQLNSCLVVLIAIPCSISNNLGALADQEVRLGTSRGFSNSNLAGIHCKVKTV